MKIGHKLLFGCVGLATLIATLGYISLYTSRTTLEKAIGENSSDLVEQLLDKINGTVYHRIENIQAHATSPLVREFTTSSNAQFENLPDPNGYIKQVDGDWVNGVDLPIISELTTNKLAERLKSLQEFYGHKCGYPVFPEIFVTNKFGVNVAQTNKTTDYYQADEDWWQIARRDGLFVSDVNYDESSGTFSAEIAVRIDDTDGSFLGVIKAVPDIKETIHIINGAKLASEYKTMQLHLVNEDAKIIYSTKGYGFLQDVHDQFAKRFGCLDRTEHSYVIGEKGKLFAHAHSRKYKDFAGLGWTLIAEIDAAEVFAPVINLRNTMLLAGVAIMGLAILASMVTYRSIIVPIAKLQNATIQIASGNLETNLAASTSDEIGQLSGSFQRMAVQLKKTISDLNDEVVGRKQSEGQLRESKDQLKTILDSIQTGVFIIDPETHTIVDANTIAAKLVGVPRERLVGSVCHKHICPAEKGQCPITDLGQSVDNSERVLLTAKGEKCPISKTVTTVMLGGRKHLLESFVDITERKQTEERLLAVNTLQKLLLPPVPIEQKLKFITDAVVRILDADFARIWVIKPGDRCEAGCTHAQVTEGPHVCRFRDRCLHLIASSGRYTHINGKDHCRVPFGCYKIGLIAAGKQDKFLINEAVTDPNVHNHDWVKELGLVSFAGYRLTHTDGTPLGVLALFSKHPISPEEDALLEGITHSASQVLHTSLAEEAVENLNKDLKSTIQELSRSNRQLKDFVHVAAHDLKTPVRGIGTLADWMVSDYGDKLDDGGRENIRLLKARVIRIDELIDGMLQFSKIARNRQNEQETDLNSLVSEVIERIKPGNSIEIAVDSLPRVTCEREHMVQVFENLLSNAVAFMDKPKGLIKVGCVEQGDFWRFYVRDNGPGIEKKHWERIFKIFQTLPTKDEPDTAGVGLTITRKIVEIYGGKIWVESQPGQGSTFFFTFPGQREEAIYANTKADTAC